MNTDLATPRYTLSQVAAVASIEPDTLKEWGRRFDFVTTLGDDYAAGQGPGRKARYSLRATIFLAIVARLSADGKQLGDAIRWAMLVTERPIPGRGIALDLCINWLEGGDPSGWRDWWLCIDDRGGAKAIEVDPSYPPPAEIESLVSDDRSAETIHIVSIKNIARRVMKTLNVAEHVKR